MEYEYYIINGIKWEVPSDRAWRGVSAICPKHNLKLRLYRNNYDSCTMKCPECKDEFEFELEKNELQEYIIDKINSKVLSSTKFINLDDEAIPLAESKDKTEDNRYFVTTKLVKSKVGLRLIIYAGEQGKKEKTQIFVEPDIKRVSFDQKDLNPADVFIKVEGIFNDGSSHTISKQ